MEKLTVKWRPGLQPDFAMAFILLLAWESVNRGADHLLGDSPGVSSSLSFVEKAMPIEAWGIIFLVNGALVAGGAIAHRFIPILAGSLLGFAAYTSLAVGMVVAVWGRGLPPDGWRAPNQFMVIGLLFGLIGLSAYFKRTAAIATEVSKEGWDGTDTPRPS